MFTAAEISWESAYSTVRFDRTRLHRSDAATSLMAFASYAGAAMDLQAGAYAIARDEARDALALHRSLHYARSTVGDNVAFARASAAMGYYDDALHAVDDASRTAASLRAPTQNACDAFSSPAAVQAFLRVERASIELEIGDDTAALRDLPDTQTMHAGDAAAQVSLAAARVSLALASRQDPGSDRERDALESAIEQSSVAAAAFAQRAKNSDINALIDACSASGAARIVPDRFAAVLLTDPLYGRREALGEAHFIRASAQAGDPQMQEDALRDAQAAKDAFEHLGQSSGDLDWQNAALQALLEARMYRANAAVMPHVRQHLVSVTYGVNQQASPSVRWKAYYAIARAYAALDDQANTIAAYERAIAILEVLRGRLSPGYREAFLEDKLRVYDDYVEYLLTHGRKERAFEVWQMRVARATLDLMRTAQFEQFAQHGPPAVLADIRLQQSFQTMMQRYSDLEQGGSLAQEQARQLWPQITRVQQQLAQSARRLNAGSTQERRYALIFHAAPLTLDEVRSQEVRPGEAILVYAWLPHSVAVWTISRSASPRVAIVPRDATDEKESIASQIRHAFVETAFVRKSDAFRVLSSSLYASLVGAAHVPRHTKTLVVVPSGMLFDVPWEALIAPGRSPQCRVHYLVCDYAVAYSASPQIALISRVLPPPATARPLLAFADPVFGNGRLNGNAGRALGGVGINGIAPLPNSLKEARASAPADIESGAHASWPTLATLNANGALARYRYVLFATHGALPEDGSEPAIVLSYPARKNGGWVTASRIAQLHLNAKTVLLSACWTGAYSASGYRPSGDGVSQLTRAFFYAGAHSVGVTLWPVEDAAAPRITPAFFRYVHGGSTPAEALQSAKIAMIGSAEMNDPYFWAPMVLYGDAR